MGNQEWQGISGKQWVRIEPEWAQCAMARRACLEMFMEKFGVDAAMVSVPKLSKIIGVSRSWIYESVKAGSFFIEHRMVGASPMFPVDAVIDWYRGDLPARAEPRSERARPSQTEEPGANVPQPVDRYGRIDTDGLVASVLQAMEAGGQKGPAARAGV